MTNRKHIANGLLGAWAAAVLLWAGPVLAGDLAGDGDVRQVVHDSLSAELPSVRTETHLPDAEALEHGLPDEQREHRRKDGEHERDDRDRDHREQKDHDGHEGRESRDRQEGHDEHGRIERGEVGEHGEIGEHGSGAGTMDEEHGRGTEDHGGGTGPDKDHKD